MIHHSLMWKYSIKIYCQSELTMTDSKLFSDAHGNSECGQMYLMGPPSKTVNIHFDY